MENLLSFEKASKDDYWLKHYTAFLMYMTEKYWQYFQSSPDRFQTQHFSTWPCSIQKMEEDKNGFVLFGLLDEVPVATSTAKWNGEMDKANEVTFWFVAVDDNEQGKGIGRGLLTELIQTIINEHPQTQTAKLTVGAENNSAIKLYSSLGFKPTNTYIQPVNKNGKEYPLVEMVLNLADYSATQTDFSVIDN